MIAVAALLAAPAAPSAATFASDGTAPRLVAPAAVTAGSPAELTVVGAPRNVVRYEWTVDSTARGPTLRATFRRAGTVAVGVTLVRRRGATETLHSAVVVRPAAPPPPRRTRSAPGPHASRHHAVAGHTPLTAKQIADASAAFDRLLPFQEGRFRAALTCSYYDPALLDIIQHPFFEKVACQALQAKPQPALEDYLQLCDRQTLDLIASFQGTVVDDLVSKTLRAAEQFAPAILFVTGGVAANNELRRSFEERGARAGLPVFFPSRPLSTDNAAMIAAAAYPKFLMKDFAAAEFSAESSLALR